MARREGELNLWFTTKSQTSTKRETFGKVKEMSPRRMRKFQWDMTNERMEQATCAGYTIGTNNNNNKWHSSLRSALMLLDTGRNYYATNDTCRGRVRVAS